jgi:hypothetical protein
MKQEKNDNRNNVIKLWEGKENNKKENPENSALNLSATNTEIP